MKKASGREDDAMIWVGTGHEGVSSLWTFIHPSEHMHIHQYMFETPVEENRVKVWLVNLRNFLIEDKHDERVIARNEYVVLQDRDVLEDLQPVETPPTNNNEYFMPADICIGRYRERLQEWEARGWRIDSKTVAGNAHNTAYAIPSPGRRDTGNWVLDPVPLIAGNSAIKKATGT